MIELEYAWIYPVRIAVNLDELVDSLIHKVPPLHDGIKKTATGDPVTVCNFARTTQGSVAPTPSAIKKTATVQSATVTVMWLIPIAKERYSVRYCRMQHSFANCQQSRRALT
ncbi:MAG TPA: hypothetical protein P5121_40010 [Caldilineaceae bacterium]|nr:hypothetical protein [Caldilineaceae bacterium]